MARKRSRPVHRWCTGDLAADPREAELVVAFALGVGRRGAVQLAEESPGVEHRELGCGRGVREEELVARSVEVDAERELSDPLGYGEGAGCVRWIACGDGASGVGRSPVERDTLRSGALVWPVGYHLLTRCESADPQKLRLKYFSLCMLWAGG